MFKTLRILLLLIYFQTASATDFSTKTVVSPKGGPPREYIIIKRYDGSEQVVERGPMLQLLRQYPDVKSVNPMDPKSSAANDFRNFLNSRFGISSAESFLNQPKISSFDYLSVPTIQEVIQSSDPSSQFSIKSIVSPRGGPPRDYLTIRRFDGSEEIVRRGDMLQLLKQYPANQPVDPSDPKSKTAANFRTYLSQKFNVTTDCASFLNHPDISSYDFLSGTTIRDVARLQSATRFHFSFSNIQTPGGGIRSVLHFSTDQDPTPRPVAVNGPSGLMNKNRKGPFLKALEAQFGISHVQHGLKATGLEEFDFISRSAIQKIADLQTGQLNPAQTLNVANTWVKPAQAGCPVNLQLKSSNFTSVNHPIQNAKPGFDVTPFGLFDPQLYPVDFYHETFPTGNPDPTYLYTNFAPTPFQYLGKIYPTSEQAFQAMKFLPNRPDLAEKIRLARRPMEAFNIAKVNQSAARSDWHQIKNEVMHQVLLQKFSQNPQLLNQLLATGQRKLTEWTDHPGGNVNVPIDTYWGTNRHTNEGKNHLGNLLMLVRGELGNTISQNDAQTIMNGLIADASP